MSGWIKLHRKLLAWEWYDDHSVKILFVHLLLTANYKKSRWRGQTIEVGQVLTGRVKLAKDTGLSERSIRTALTKLKSTNEIAIKTTSKYSVITIINYASYQETQEVSDQQSSQQPDQQATNKRPTNDHIQEDQEIKKNKKIRNKNIYLPEVEHSLGQDQSGNPKHLCTDCAYVALSDHQKKLLIQNYNESGLTIDDAHDAIKHLDSYLAYNKKKQKEYTSHYHVLIGWLKDRAIKVRKDKLALELQEKRNNGNGNHSQFKHPVTGQSLSPVIDSGLATVNYFRQLEKKEKQYDN